MSEIPPSPDHDDAPTTSSAPPARRLLRSRDDRVLGGVCGGIARYFRIDPLIPRVAAIALLFAGGFSLIAYLAALALVPADDDTGNPPARRPSRLATVVGAGLIVLAGVALLHGGWGVHTGWAFGALGPLAVLALVLAIVGQRLLRGRGEDAPGVTRVIGAALVLCGILVGSLLLAVAAGWAAASGGGTIVAALVIALGVAMVGLSFKTSKARWLALPALVLAIPAGVVSAAGIDAEGGVGQRTYRPATLADVHADGYRLGTGEAVVDLRDLDWPTTGPVHVKVKVGIGHALVLVPRDVCVRSTAHAGIGYVDVLGQDDGGADVDQDAGSLERFTGRTLILDTDVGLGAIEVLHERSDHGGRRFHDGSGGSISDQLADAGCAGARA